MNEVRGLLFILATVAATRQHSPQEEHKRAQCEQNQVLTHVGDTNVLE
jgi:hypothetical protein